MARKFKDAKGRSWIAERPHASSDLVFRPLEGSERDERLARLPGHTKDPYELSDQELVRLLDGARPRYSKPKRPSPFKDGD